MPTIPPRFQKAVDRIRTLERHDRFLGAFIFGSVARGETTEHSDLDVKVVTDRENTCSNINHPLIARIKLDITFKSLKQLEREMVAEHAGGRIPMLAESVIVFDKDGALAKLKAECEKMRPPRTAPDGHQFIQFMCYHADDKVRRNLENDPDTALLAMTVGLNDLLNMHIKLHGRWKVSSKRLFSEFDAWDPGLAALLRRFVRTADLKEKFHAWSDIIEHVLRPIGGRQSIKENNCACASCGRDLKALLEPEEASASGFPPSRE